MLATVVQWLLLATLTGVVVGSGTSLFLHGLFFATAKTANISLPLQMLLLPAGGLLNGLLLYYGYRANRTGLKDSIFAAIDEQAGRMPFRTILIKPVATILTIGCGGSGGKEGPCSHIGASLASALGGLFRLNTELRLRLVACGVSAGFASVFGTPIAGAIYGVEVLAIGRIRADFLLPAIVAGVTSYRASLFWQVPYEVYPLSFDGAVPLLLFLKIAVLGVLCGYAAMLFVEFVNRGKLLTHLLQTRFSLWPPLMPLLGGLLLAVLILFLPRDYLGLSLPMIDRAIAGELMSFSGVFWKILLVAITIGSGFYAGIVTPQFVIGAVLGGAVAGPLGIAPALGAAVGLVSVVAAASNAPIAAILMGVELFRGTVALPYLAGGAVVSYLIIGHRSIYSEQRFAFAKSSWIRIRADVPAGQEKAHLSYGLARWWQRWTQ